MILLLAYYPDVQLKLRNELDKFIMSTSSSSNSSITTNVEQQQQSIGPNHKHQFPYTMAFIYETLRFRNVVPFGLLHRSMAKTTIDNKYPVPDNTVVLFNHYAILMDDQHWPSARTFKPERFLSGFNDNDNTNNDNQTTTTTSSGQLASSRVRLNKSQAFMPFGFGRRQCLGIKLAVNELFYVLVQFLRLTNNYDIVYDTNCTDKLQSTTTGATGNDVDDDVDNVLDGDNISVIDQLTKPYKIILKTKSN
ncbi:probable cytochrome P450 508A4 [Oppia nitens]|uniref:probable cytochrome P450 508A4 n=1 Tax=Oppia nitens TaxID=1686743 RepID=UPI0023DC22B9|nr:probable cytochrome P450 508A4 [Oppia nitens]